MKPDIPFHPPRWALYPAIDIYQGACVRLSQGDFSRLDKYNSDPVDQAGRFQDMGARCLHVVDLDGAREGSPRNRHIITTLAQRYPDLYIQVGGGVRDDETVAAYLDAGIAAVIIGTACLSRPDWVQQMARLYPGRIKIGLDARGGRLAVAGWLEQSEVSATEVAERFCHPDVAAIIYTDIDKDGTLMGANVDATTQLARAQSIPVIASGGVAGMDDLSALYQRRQDNLAGIIIGKALYTDAIDLAKAIQFYDRF